jgi:thioredoxin reductase (NADPH)
MALGAKRFTPKIKGIKEYEGKGISYCAICDGFFHKNKEVAVLGDGEYAISEALELADVVNKVTILTNGSPARETRHPNIIFNSKKIREFRGSSETIENISFEDNSFLNVSGIFIAEGSATSTDLAKKLGIELHNNSISVNENMATNIPGIFACGDCTGGLAQISKAVYEGTKAGLSAISFVKLVK